MGSVPRDHEKKFGIERLKALSAIVFQGSSDPADAKAWLNLLDKCFEVMSYPKKRKVRLATFLFHKKVEGWQKFILFRHRDTRTLDWKMFISLLVDKYYPSIYYKAKRYGFLRLQQELFSVPECKRKYTKLSRYAEMVIVSESDRCKRFERGLRKEIQTHVTAIAKWSNNTCHY